MKMHKSIKKFIHFLVNVLNYIPLSSIPVRAKVLQWDFLNGLFYLPKGVKTGDVFVSLKRLWNYFVQIFPWGLSKKQLGQFFVKTQWTKHIRRPDILNQQLDYLQLSLTSGPIPPGNRMHTRYKKIKIAWTSSCSTCSS